MKNYPSITGKISRDVEIIAFDKLDGSNVRAEWSAKHKKFVKFGRKEGLLDDSNPILKISKDLIVQKYEKDLTKIFLKEQIKKAVCFFEFFGKETFVGIHQIGDKFDVVLFDIFNCDTGEMLGPREFIKLTKEVETTKMLYRGKAGKEFEETVRNGQLEGMTFEGVVVKSLDGKFVFKIKNNAWIEKLKTLCGQDTSKFNELL